MADETGQQEQPPILRVVDADATPEEIAAIVAVISSTQDPATPSPAVVGRASEWLFTSGLRGAAQVRPRSWRASHLSS
jgi:hypothetical protein